MKTPKLLLTTNVIILSLFLMPLFYLFWRFADLSRNLSRFLNSWNVSTLLFNTVLLFFAVVFTSLLLGLTISVLTVRYKFPGSKILFSLTILPLVIPSYIGALTYVSVFSPKGLYWKYVYYVQHIAYAPAMVAFGQFVRVKIHAWCAKSRQMMCFCSLVML